MFKKKKKEFAPGTFIPTPLRILAILQLCLVFTLTSWLGGYPFMGEHFAIKSKSTLYTYVMDAPSFSSLPNEKQTEIKAGYDSLHSQLTRPFFSKLADSIRILLFDASPFAIAWIVFACAISILILLKIEGARQTAWLLPFIVLAYGIDNRMNGYNPPIPADAALFPSESLLVEQYIQEPLKDDIMKQHDQLLRGWNLFLVNEWAKESPSSNEIVFKEQIEKGSFAFTVARVDRLKGESITIPYSGMRQQEWLALLVLYFGWNLYFAWMMNRHQDLSK